MCSTFINIVRSERVHELSQGASAFAFVQRTRFDAGEETLSKKKCCIGIVLFKMESTEERVET